MTFPSSIINLPNSNIEDGEYELLARTKVGLTKHKMFAKNGYAHVCIGEISTTAGKQYISAPLFNGHLEKTNFGYLHTRYLDIPKTVEEAFRLAYGDIRNVLHIKNPHQGKIRFFGENGFFDIKCDDIERRYVIAGNTIHYSGDKPWKYLTDFLKYYPQYIFGKDFWMREKVKPVHEKLPFIHWYDCLWEESQKAMKKEHGEFQIEIAAARACLAFAWDLFVASDNSAYQQDVVERMKNLDNFHDARYELFVAATSVKAGYKIQFEDEKDRSKKHVEFIAKYKKTGESIQIEAKTLRYPGVLGYKMEDGKTERKRDNIIKNINKALEKKDKEMPFVIFLDL